MRDASDMLSKVKTLKEEVERLERMLQNNFRATSEECRRLEARLELLEQSSHRIAQACQNRCCQPPGYASVTIEPPERAKDNAATSKEESRRLLQGGTSSRALTDNWEIPVQDPAMRLKVAKRASRNHNCMCRSNDV
jgi:hypothetical protein